MSDTTYRVYLDGEIDEDKSSAVIAELHEAAVEYPGCNIEFVISCGGGNVYDGTAIYSELRSMSRRGGGNHHVTTKVRGLAASIATLIFEAGDLRVGGPLDVLMYHEPKICVSDEFISSVAQRVSDMENWERSCLDIMMQRAKAHRSLIADLTGPVDREVLIPEAVELGLADEVA